MTLKLHNTLTGSKDAFKPPEDQVVKIYSCGPTVYDYPHIGNWMGYVVWDVLVRLLENEGYDVKRIVNITDVGHLTGDNEGDADTGEDKLAKKAKKESKTAWDIAKHYTEYFLRRSKDLGLVEPNKFPKATDYINQQLELVRTLKEKGFTYQIDDGIYFNTSKFPSYAKFAHLDLKALKAGARVKQNPQKKNQSDFALWKFSPVDEKRDMEWKTPDDLADSNTNHQLPTMGFPGWHLECSAMIMSLLGETIDIHTGGIDHIPVHHTNEIAQSEAATGNVLSNFWLHNNHLKSDGTKISKSLDNGYTLEDLEEKGFSTTDYRMFVLQSHYRSEGNFSFDNLEAARNRLNNWRNIAALRHQTHDTLQNDDEKSTSERGVSLYATSLALIETLEDDIDTPGALAVIDEAFTKLASTQLKNIHQHALTELLTTIDELLGLQLTTTTPDINDNQKQLIIERKHARTNQDWKKSDNIRDELEKQGISLNDKVGEVIWEYTT